MGRAQQELVDDTFRVLSIGFSYFDGPESISRYFSRHGARPYAFIAYTNLGDLYLEQERYQDAADAYHAFVELDPYHAKAPLLQVEVIEAFKKGAFADLVLDGKENFVETYGPDSPYWQRYTFEQQPEVVAHLKSNVTDLAAYHHAQAQETQEAREYAAAARWYRSVSAIVPRRSRTRAKTNFLLAEVLFESGNFRDAAFEYERTAYAYPFHEQGGEAGYAALLAYTKHEEQLRGGERAEWHRRGIDSELAVRRQPTRRTRKPRPCKPTPPRSCSRSASSARARRRPGRSWPARRPSSRLCSARRGPSSRIPSSISRISPAAETAYVQLARVRSRATTRSAARSSERIASSIYKQGEQARSAGQLDVAVEHFLRVAQAAPSSPMRATAEYDAGAALIQLGDWQRATTVLERLPQLASRITSSRPT